MSERTDHISVLKKEVLDQFDYLSEIGQGYFFDGTLGAAGHSIAIAQKSSKKIHFIGLDIDQSALELAKTNVAKEGLSKRFTFERGNFKDAKEILEQLGIESISGALVDLGVSSMQFDQPERGFSFKYPAETLDMRMNQEQDLTAKDILNNYPESVLERIFRDYGEEKFARNIAKYITQRRKRKKIETVGDLLEVLASAIPKKFQFGRTHYATKVFQALRIEVNAELKNLDQAIFDIVAMLQPGGRLAVITFHSLEDRIIKKSFLKLQNPCECPPSMPCACGKEPIASVLTKKPICPDEEEIGNNLRSRSAKLRVIEKL